jgi:Pyridoxal phosphate biosynthesis protein
MRPRNSRLTWWSCIRQARERVYGNDREAGIRTAPGRGGRGAGAKLQVNAGHGINYRNMAFIHKIPHLLELNIGHSIVARAMFVGFEDAVREMLGLMEGYRG